ncbi:MAG TPA: hypothetical protein VNO75_12305 [Gemmatimonadaceae bacterium]|nr:hypothetical protein [Gemmatimonadaceae bacterium]
MDKIKELIRAGSSIPGAIREVLSQRGLSIAAFSDRYDRNRQNMSMVIAGNRAPAQADVDALIAELGGTDLDWRELLHEAGRPALKAT